MCPDTQDTDVLVRVSLNADTAAEERMPPKSSVAVVIAMFQWHMAVLRSRWPVVRVLRNESGAVLADTSTLDSLAAADAPDSLGFFFRAVSDHCFAIVIGQGVRFARIDVQSTCVCAQEVSEWTPVLPKDMYLALTGDLGCEEHCDVLSRLEALAPSAHLDCSALSKRCDFRSLTRVLAYLSRAPACSAPSSPVSSCSFARNDLGDSFALCLRSSLEGTRCKSALQSLRLSGNCFTADGVEAVADAVQSSMPHLQLLDLSYSWDAAQFPMESPQSRRCAEALAGSALTSLDMSGCGLSMGQLLALPLAVARLSSTLRWLRLDHNPQRTPQDMQPLAEALVTDNLARDQLALRGLSLHGLVPTSLPGWCPAVRCAVSIPQLQVLNLSCTDLGGDGARTLADAIRLGSASSPISATNQATPHLQELLLECCNIGRSGFRDLSNALCPPRQRRRFRLHALSLHGNKLSACLPAELSSMLVHADCPSYLNLSTCGLGRVQMFEVLTHCRVPMQLLQLSGNSLGQFWEAGRRTEDQLAKLVWSASGLRALDLRHNLIEGGALERLSNKMSKPMRLTGRALTHGSIVIGSMLTPSHSGTKVHAHTSALLSPDYSNSESTMTSTERHFTAILFARVLQSIATCS